MALITLDTTIKQSISDHPSLSWNGSPVEREVQFIAFDQFNVIDKRVVLIMELQLTMGGVKKIPIEYKLSASIYLNTVTFDVAKDEDGNIITNPDNLDPQENWMTEVDIWLNSIINVVVADETLIQTAITNLDQSQHYFDQYY
jgi:hypothetical protein